MRNVTVNYLDRPDLRPLKVLMWYSGSFPVSVISMHSFSLPKMLWPNATFYIRCRRNERTAAYIAKVMKGARYVLIDDNVRPWKMSFEQYDLIYNYDYWFRWIGLKKYRDSLDYSEINYIIYQVKKPIYLLYCDKEVFHKIENTPIFAQKDGYPWLKYCDPKKDFSNVHIMFNQDICRNWAMDCIDWKSFEPAEKMFEVIYLNMRLYYQLPSEYSPKNYSTDKIGCYFGTFFEKRAKFFNTVMNVQGPKKVNLEIGGRTVCKVKDSKYYHEGCIETFQHEEIFNVLKPYDWALFIGRVTPLDYLGMTFYLPFVAGMPVFCLRTCFEGVGNPFEGLDCFFSTEDELAELVKKADLNQLFVEQTSRLKALYYHD